MISSKKLTVVSALALVFILLAGLLAEFSEARYRGGGSYYRPSYSQSSMRSTPVRAMQPRQMNYTPRQTPQMNRYSQGNRSYAQGTRSVRQYPATIRQNTPITRVSSFTGRVSTSGSPIISNRAGRTFAVPQQAMFSPRVSLMSSSSRVAINARLASELKSNQAIISKAQTNWSRSPKTIQDQMTLAAAKKGEGRRIMENLGDSRYKGMEKWEYKVKSNDKRDTVVHYVRDPKSGKLMDFKFKKHSADQ